ncbi:MAG: hypothetical protein J0L55_06790 [Caulobacterales bacterium]|nr:hypothetical protein [Caulobacterales bacterium]MCA0373133.1 TorF family putative porin [Pseudomonadota bacterium]
MKKTIIALSAIASVCAIPAFAQDMTPKFSGSITLANDYIWRGATQTDNKAAVFLAGQVNIGNFYVGAGTENVDFGGINQEYDIWGGYVAKLGEKTSLDIGFVRYGYVDAPSNIDTTEFKAALTQTIGKGSLTGSVYTTSNFFGSKKSATYYEVAGVANLSEKVSLSGALARQNVEGSGGDYNTWNLGVGYTINKNVGLDFRYHDAEDLDSAFVASVKFSF